MSLIEEMVIKRIRMRAEKGLNKYGTDMMRTDLDLLQWHQHFLEELLDAAVYTQRIIYDLEQRIESDENNQ